MGASPSYWLMKSEPSVYSIEDLENDGPRGTSWNGVRNYQARNFLRSMKPGDLALFYHSNAEPSAAVGEMEVVAPAEPDPTQFDPKDDHYDPDSSPKDPRWWQVRVRFRRRFRTPASLDRIKAEPSLKDMALLKRSRLSVQPVTPEQWRAILRLADRG